MHFFSHQIITYVMFYSFAHTLPRGLQARCVPLLVVGSLVT